jgi:hypothetical protein
MKFRHALPLSLLALACAGFATAASAQGLTRAEVRQQLIQAEDNGSRFVSNTSYPDVSPVFAQQVAHQKQTLASVGGVPAGASASGSPRAVARPAAPSGCVGPADFCTPYFGS